MMWLLFFFATWEVIAAVAGMPFGGAEEGAKVLFDDAGPVLVVSRCVQRTQFNLRTFDRVLLMDTLNCGDDNKHVVIPSGHHVYFFAQEKTLAIVNTEIMVEQGAQLTLAAEKSVTLAAGPESEVMIIVEGALNICAGGHEDADMLTYQNMAARVITTVDSGTFSFFEGSIIDDSDDHLTMTWPHDTGTYYTALHSSKLATVDDLVVFNSRITFETPTEGAPSDSMPSTLDEEGPTGTAQEPLPHPQYDRNTPRQLNQNGKPAARCGIFNIWCRTKALAQYVYYTLGDFAFGKGSTSSSGSDNSKQQQRQRQRREAGGG